MDDVPWLTSDERAGWLAVAALMTKLPGALDAQLQADAGVSFFEYMVLAVLSEQPDRTLQMSEIAHFVSGSLSRLSHTAKRLEGQGLLSRAQVPGQGRRTNATLTERGYQAVVEAAPGHVRHVRRLLIDALSGEDLAVLARVGDEVLGQIERAEEPVREPGEVRGAGR